jgi:catechol 2,3-dioxygenase-like lactoylglutathione lyase family enzyme
MTPFHHVGITVRDIEASYRFYTEVLEMRVWNQEEALEVEAPTERRNASADEGPPEFMVFGGPAFDVLTNNPGAQFKYVMLQSSDGGFVLQLTEYVAGGEIGPRGSHNRTGGLHMSFFTDDVEGRWKELTESGEVSIISEVVQITPSMRSFYVEDPDGVPVELIEVSR